MSVEKSLKSKTIIIKSLIALYLLLFVYINLYHFEWLFSSWIKSSHYQHVLFFVFILVLLIFQKFKYKIWRCLALDHHLKGTNIIIPLIALFFSALAQYYYKAPFLGALSIWILSGFFVFKFLVMRKFERIYLVIFLIIITPFPYVYQLTSYLQISSSVLAGNLLSLFGVVNVVDNGRIVINSGTFVVGPASSGIRSFLVLPTFSIILLIWKPLKIKLGISFILLSFLTAQFYNMIRVTSMLITAVFTDPYRAYDLFHDRGNTIIFFIALISIYWLYKKVCQK